MGLITREGKGSKLTIAEMDGNLEFLNGSYKNIGDSSETSTIDWSEAKTQEINLDNNPTLTFTNAESGDSLSLLLKSDTTQRNVNWPSNVRWNRGVAPTIAKLLQNGTIDYSFLSGTGFIDSMNQTNTSVGICYVLSTGKILIWNNTNGVQRYNGTTLPAPVMGMGNNDLIRLNADGTLDTTWSPNNWLVVQPQPGQTNRGVRSILELPDGRILVGGDFINMGMPTFGNAHLQLLSADGVRDNTFQPSIGANANADGVNVITRQSNGKIIIAGNFSTVGMTTTLSIARFNSNLTLDTGFTTRIGDGMMSNVTVTTLDIDSNDSIFIGTTSKGFPVNGSGSYNNLVALDANGAILSGFSQTYFPPNGFNIGNPKILINNTTNRITVCWTPMGASQTGIVRFLPNGTVDSSFNVGTGLSFGPAPINVEMIALPGNKILALGDFIGFNGTPISRICAINNNGEIDTSINIPSSGFNLSAFSALNAALQVNGDILVTGPFSTYGGATANAIVSINLSTDTEMYTKIDFKYTGVNYIGSF
jgi:uncharacterized delta-60 repeat protein